MPSDIVSQTVNSVRKTAEFKTFCEVISQGEIPDTWEIMAEALGVRAATISAWKKLPEFQAALINGIKRSMGKMETVGKKDWKMWRDRLGLLIKESNKSQHQLNVQGDVNITQIAQMTDEQISSRLNELERILPAEGRAEPAPVHE